MRNLINKALSLLLILSLYGCTVDDQPTPIEPLKRSVRYVSSDDIPNILGKLNESLSHLSAQHKSINGGQVSTPWGEIDLNEILEVVDTLQNTNYTFAVSDDDGNPYTFTNLIIKKRESGSIDTPFLLEYKPDSSYINQFIADGFSIENFTGIISRKFLSPPSANNQGSIANLEGRSNIDQCTDDTHFSGGNTSTTITTPAGDGLTGMSISTNCFAVVYHLDEVIPPGPKYRPEENYWSSLFPGEDIVVWVCSETYSFDVNDVGNCPTTETEDIGVLFEGFDEFIRGIRLDESYYGPGINGMLDQLWRNDLLDPHAAGFLTGICETVDGAWSMSKFLWAWASPFNVTAEQMSIRYETWQLVMLLNRIITEPNFRNQAWDTLKIAFSDYIQETVGLDKQARFNQGKILFDVATLFIGVGEIKAILKGQELVVGILTTLNKLNKVFSVPLVQARRIGLNVVKNGNIVLVKSAGGIDDIARVSYNKLRISKHQIEAKDGSVVFKEASEVNSTFPSTYDPPYDKNTVVTEFTTSKDEQFVRVYKQTSNSQPSGSWVMKKNDIDGLTNSQIKDKFSLPQTPDRVVDVLVPANKSIRVGKAAPINNFGANGGGIQFELHSGISGVIFSTIRILNP